MTGATSSTPTVVVRTTSWEDPVGDALRTAMRSEIDPRYADRAATMPPPPQMAVDAADVVHVAVAEVDGQAVGHVAVRRLGDEYEIKRMYVCPEARGRGVGTPLLVAAEQAVVALGGHRVILQTGDRQPEAHATYERNGYHRIPIFEPYTSLPFSRCYAKHLSAPDGAR